MPFTRFYKMNPLLGMAVEEAFYEFSRTVSNYDGGAWEVVVDSDDVYAVYPVSSGSLEVGHDGNYVLPIEISSRAFGVYVSLAVYNKLCWLFHDQGNNALCGVFSSMYHSLRIWMIDTTELPPAEVEHILRMID